MKTACAGAWEILAGAPLDDGDVDPRQSQLARQHQPCRASSGDYHRMLSACRQLSLIAHDQKLPRTRTDDVPFPPDSGQLTGCRFPCKAPLLVQSSCLTA